MDILAFGAPDANRFGINPTFSDKIAEKANIEPQSSGSELTGRALLDKWKEKGNDYAMHDSIGLASIMLVEMADHCQEEPEKRIGFPTHQNLVATLLGFAACQLAMKCIAEAMPTPEEITEDAYWAAMELLDAAGLDFESLFNFHCNAGAQA